MKIIMLTRGLFTLVDDVDFDRFGHFYWQAQKNAHTYYATRKDGKRHVYLHKEIVGGADDVDHRNGVGLDNRRKNLRHSDHSRNGANSLRSHNSTGLKGVIATPRNKTNPWRAEVRRNGVACHLGYFPTAQAAARAYQAKAIELYGEFARFTPEPLNPLLDFLQGDFAKQRERARQGSAA